MKTSRRRTSRRRTSLRRNGDVRITGKQFAGYYRMRREGPSANDDYNVRTFGVTNEQFRVLKRLENNIGGSGYYMTLDEINKYLDGAKVGLSRASQSDIDAVAKAFTRRLRANSRRRTSLRRNSNHLYTGWIAQPAPPGSREPYAWAPTRYEGRAPDEIVSQYNEDTYPPPAKVEVDKAERRVLIYPKSGHVGRVHGELDYKGSMRKYGKRTYKGIRSNSRRRTSLRRNRGDYRSGMLTDRDYMSLGDRLTRSVLSTAGYKPHNNFEEDSKHWRQARIDALAALMVESMLDGPRAGIEERDAAMHIAVDVAQRNRY